MSDKQKVDVEMELKNAVLYGMGYVAGKHNLTIDKAEREAKAVSYAANAKSGIEYALEILYKGEDDHDKILRLVGEDAAAKYDLGVAYSKMIDEHATKIQGE
jgi:hypothetical protein